MSARFDLLSVTRLVLRILVVLNILFGVGLAAATAVSLVASSWVLSLLSAHHGDAAPALLAGGRLVILVALAGVPLGYLFLTRLLAMVETVQQGDPFIPENARRLQVIAQAMLGLQVLSLVEGMIGAAHPGLEIEAGFSVDGWLAVLLLFVLARVFHAGTRMRADLEGTV